MMICEVMGCNKRPMGESIVCDSHAWIDEVEETLEKVMRAIWDDNLWLAMDLLADARREVDCERRASEQV